MARVVLPKSSIRARRRRRRNFLIGGSILLFFVACGALIWLANADFLRIKTVKTAGAKTVVAEVLQAEAKTYMAGKYLYLFPKDNIFLYPKNEIAAKLLTAYPTLKSAVVRAENFSTISIYAEDREPRALWCGNSIASPNPCLLLGEDGVAYAAAPDFSESPYVRYFGELHEGNSNLPQGAKQFLSPEEFRPLAALADAVVQSQTTNAVEGVFVNEDKDVRMAFTNGFALLFELEDDGGEVFERFTLALTAEPFKSHTLAEFEYLDLRFGDKLYYKLK